MKELVHKGIENYNHWASLTKGKYHPLKNYGELRGVLYNKLKETINPILCEYPISNYFHKKFVPDDLMCQFDDDCTLKSCVIREANNKDYNTRNQFLDRLRTAVEEVFGSPFYAQSFNNIVNQIKNYTT